LAPDVIVHFNTKVIGIDCKSNEVLLDGLFGKRQEFDLIVGADGAGSIVRRSMDQ
jgi:kynurenine 3-monooxygenase